MVNIRKGRITSVMSLILSVLALYASTISLLDKGIYNSVLSSGIYTKALMPGTISQDIISVAAAVILAVLSIVFLKRPGYKIFIIMIGLLGFFFYGYGLYVISGTYTSIYPAYIIIFTLSIYGLIIGCTAFKKDEVLKARLSGALRKAIAIFLVINIIMFVPIWIISLLPFTTTHLRPDFYAVYIMDLCIVMPALGIISGMLFKNKPFGNILAGVMLIKALTLILSVAIGTFFASAYDRPVDSMLPIYCAVVVISLILGVLYMRNLKMEERTVATKKSKSAV